MGKEELNIKNIKKKIVDSLMNNIDILNYFAKYTEIEHLKIEQLYNTLIYDYDCSTVGYDYITVEVSELEPAIKINIDDKKYQVIIKMGLQNEEKVCDMSCVVADIINKLYPYKKKFSNTTFITTENCISVGNYNGYISMLPDVSLNNRTHKQLHRVITFEI